MQHCKYAKPQPLSHTGCVHVTICQVRTDTVKWTIWKVTDGTFGQPDMPITFIYLSLRITDNTELPEWLFTVLLFMEYDVEWQPGDG